MAPNPDLGLGLESRERAGTLQRPDFSRIACYLRDNAISIGVICFEDSGQQKNGTTRRVSGQAPTHVKVGQPPTKPQAGLMSCKFHVLCDAGGDVVSPFQLDVIRGISA